MFVLVIKTGEKVMVIILLYKYELQILKYNAECQIIIYFVSKPSHGI
jgi:hypothetical protein